MTKKTTIKKRSKTIKNPKEQTVLNKLTLPPTQRALFYTGMSTPNLLARFYKLSPHLFKVLEYGILIGIVLSGAFIDLRYFLLLPLIGATVFLQDYVTFGYWYLKVFVFQRRFYKDRRELYTTKISSLVYFMEHYRPKIFRPTVDGQKLEVIIWANTPKLQTAKFNFLQKSGKLEAREYIRTNDK